MITIDEVNKFNNSLSLMALSTDDLPVDYIVFYDVEYKIRNGSTAYFMDTKQAKIFSEEDNTWYDVQGGCKK